MAWVTAAPIRAAEDTPSSLLPSPGHLSFSQVTNLAPEVTGGKYGCARKWGYERLLGLPFVGGDMLRVGSCVDRGADAFLSSRIGGWPIAQARHAAEAWAADALVETGLQGGRHERVVREALQLLLDHIEDLVPAAVQQRLDYTVRSLDGRRARRMTGFLDWLKADGTIVDLKLVGSPWSRNVDDQEWLQDKRFQLCNYYLGRLAEERRGIAQPAPVVPRGELVVVYHNAELRKPQLRVRSLSFDEEDLERVLRGIRLADQRSSMRVLPAHPGMACVTCGHLGRCRDDEAARAVPFSALTGIPG